MKKYVADFETCVWLEDETYVWAYAICEIGNEDNIIIGNSLNEFMEFCKNSNNSTIYFHNLKFDGSFILNWCLENKYEYIKDKKEAKSKTFTTLISDTGMFYQITIYFYKNGKKVKKITFFDSLKIIPFAVDKIAKSFNLPISKLKIDYYKPRPKEGYELTSEEKEYIKNDVLIVAKALKVLFSQNLTKMTQGSNALFDYKEILGKDKFSHYYSSLEKDIDKEIRRAYKGGFTYLNPVYKEKDVGAGVVLDVNSLYPSVMMEKELPICEPVFFEGKYKEDKVYKLYIQQIACTFRLKPNHIPTIQIKNSMFFNSNEYLETSENAEGDIVILYLTSVDLQLFLEHYDILYIRYLGGYKFRSIKGLFSDYINKWIKVKNESTLNGNEGMRTLAKLMLNALYGKFATSMETKSKIPYLEDGILHYELGEEEEKKGLYIPIGCFITAYAREKTIRTSQAIKEYSIKKYGKDLYCYSDTDSIHTLLPIEELKQFCEIDKVELGKWKHESSFTRARFIRQKCYIEEIEGTIKITCAGLPKDCYDKVTWENFRTGFKCDGKLVYKNVRGGTKLVNTEFTIKDDKIKRNIVKFK